MDWCQHQGPSSPKVESWKRRYLVSHLHHHPLLNVLELFVREKEFRAHLCQHSQPRRLLRIFCLRPRWLEEKLFRRSQQILAPHVHHPVLQQGVRDVGGGGGRRGGRRVQQWERVCPSPPHIWHFQHFPPCCAASNSGFLKTPQRRSKAMFFSDQGQNRILVSETWSSSLPLTRAANVRLVVSTSSSHGSTMFSHSEKTSTH